MEKLTITVKEFKDMIGVSVVTAYNIVNRADFYPAMRFGRKILINRKALDKWLDEQTQKKGDS
jgi:excisionase family DNA binding protein